MLTKYRKALLVDEQLLQVGSWTRDEKCSHRAETGRDCRYHSTVPQDPKDVTRCQSHAGMAGSPMMARFLDEPARRSGCVMAFLGERDSAKDCPMQQEP